MVARKFTEEQELIVCDLYARGETLKAIATALKVGKTTVLRVLDRHGVERRQERRFGPREESALCKRYLAGESCPRLAATFETNASTVRNVLMRHGIALRRGAESHGGLTKIAERKVCEGYLAGDSSPKLANAFGVTVSTVVAIIRRHGIATRSRRSFCDEEELEICARYIAGENTKELALALKVRDQTIGKILKRCGVQARNTEGFIDSVQHVLDGTGRHAGMRECDFYLCELNAYSQTHCKIGIAFDASARARRGGGQYGSEVLRLVFATRGEAYFLEQAALDASRDCSDCPSDLLGWTGSSEVRAIPASDMAPIVLHLADELEELGIWEFAARYVPMTAAQRAICQQRATAAPFMAASLQGS